MTGRQLHPLIAHFAYVMGCKTVLRKYGVKAWRASGSYNYREESKFLSQRTKSCLLDEAQRVNVRHATRTLPVRKSGPSVPSHTVQVSWQVYVWLVLIVGHLVGRTTVFIIAVVMAHARGDATCLCLCGGSGLSPPRGVQPWLRARRL